MIQGSKTGRGGTVEIVTYNPQARVAYVVNGKTGNLSRVDLTNMTQGQDLSVVKDIKMQDLIKENEPAFNYGDMTSVDYSPQSGLLAVAIQDEDYSKEGLVALFRDNNGNLDLVNMVKVGVQPDMVTFNQEGSLVLTANEGEPRMGYGNGAVDPKGSISLVDINSFTETRLDFSSFDNQKDALAQKGVVLKKYSQPSTDLEPEYISVSGNRAYVSLQEANSIATIDLGTKEIIDISPLGLIDHGQVAIDLDKSDETYSPKTYEGLYGIPMPDGIKAVNIGGRDYIITANEGDGREWGSKDSGTLYANEIKKKESPNKIVSTESKVTYFDQSDYLGLAQDKDYLFGGRSFSILEWDGNKLVPVFNSGAELEELTAKYYPTFFNTSNDNIDIEDRSGKKGPEPESVVVGQVGGRTYAFVTLERISGVMVYDITDPAQAKYVNYINSRNFSLEIGDDVSPEGLYFVPEDQSPTGKALLLAAMEVSGTLAVYELEGLKKEDPIIPADPSPSKEDPSPQVWGMGPMGGSKEEAKKDQKISLVKSYVAGYPDGTFMPQGQITRSEAASLLARLLVLEGREKALDSTHGTDKFSDLKNHWAESDIAFICQEGYMVGYQDGTFRPNEKITRAEFVQMIKKYGPSNGAKAPFKDIEGHWAKEAIDQAYGNQFVKGYEDNSFGPDKDISRAEAVRIFNQVFKRYTALEDIKGVKDSFIFREFPDVDMDHWAYLDVLDATNTHVEDQDSIWIQVK